MQNRHEEPKQAIRVLGDKWHGFELYRWREAFMCFLDLVWSGRYNYGPAGKIQQNNRRSGRGNVNIWIQTTQPVPRYPGETVRVSFSFSAKDDPKFYYATGLGDSLDFSRLGCVIDRNTWETLMHTKEEFESDLVRFVRNRSVDGVYLYIPNPKHVRIVQFVNDRGRLLVGIK